MYERLRLSSDSVIKPRYTLINQNGNPIIIITGKQYREKEEKTALLNLISEILSCIHTTTALFLKVFSHPCFRLFLDVYRFGHQNYGMGNKVTCWAAELLCILNGKRKRAYIYIRVIEFLSGVLSVMLRLSHSPTNYAADTVYCSWNIF